MLAVERRIGLADNRSLKDRLVSLVCETDMTGTKFILMLCALGQAIGFFTDRNCVYVACEFLREATAYMVWGTLFGLYGILKLWRIFDGKSRPLQAKVINGLGACLFGGCTTALLVARWPHWVLGVPNVVLALAAIWVFARTAINPERGFRGD